MKKTITVFSVLILAAFLTGAISTAFSQGSDLPDFQYVEEDRKALDFRLGSNLFLGSFNGSGISYKWHRNQEWASRVGFSADITYEYGETVVMNEYGQENVSTNGIAAEIHFDWIRYSNFDEPVTFFWGLGPRIRYDYQTETADVVISKSTLKTSEFGGGIGFIFGVEWFINRYFSLTGEYGVTGMLNHRTTNIERYPLPNPNSSQVYAYSIESTGARIGLSVYFN